MTESIKAALESLFNEIINFVKALFNKEVGTEIEDELAGAFGELTK